ncbi:putative histidine phosphatase superfamily, clade-1 [Septoria linicola]|nr:putative histidine phosphatase superfamily, clade-1 [Septoria linicola]
MVKPRLIILIRHAQSEGNKNRDIHQMIPDHRVKLTDEGHQQAEEAGRRLRQLLKPDDTLQIYTSPYRRTRETTEGILKTLTARDDPDDPTAAPSPFSRNKIKVYEEPRIREQDFGNFQPCSAEMERMWQERADYGHFFYRIPDGESAADAYDRISGFNESLWRQFGEDEFPSVCVLVTHGLMTRVFLMKWYHWSVEYFEDLRNVNHCEFVLMNKDERGKYVLENKMRTWSELKRQKREAEAKAVDPQRRNTLSHFLTQKQESPRIPPRKWGGCKDGCNHENEKFPRRAGLHQQRKQTKELTLPSPLEAPKDETEDTPIAHVEPGTIAENISPTTTAAQNTPPPQVKSALPDYLQHGRDGGGLSGANTPQELSEDESSNEYFDKAKKKSLAGVMRRKPQRQATPDDIERWAKESGMNNHKRADPLGDEADEESEESGDVERAEMADKSLRGSVY